MKTVGVFAAILLSAGWIDAARCEDILIRGAEVHTVAAAGTLAGADVLVRDGKIAAVGRGLTALSGTVVVEARNRPLTPGLFGGLSTIGVEEVPGESDTIDSRFSLGTSSGQQRWRPEFDVTLAYDPRSDVVPVTRIEGLTWTVLVPRNRDAILGGQGSAVTLDGRFDAALSGSRSLFVTWGSAGSSRSGGSRAAQYMLWEQAIREVSEQGAAPSDALLNSGGRVALAPYLSGGRVVFHVERAADIHRVIEFARRHGMRPVISGGTEAWVIAPELAAAQVPVILDPLANLPDSFDELGARLDNAALLNRAGVRIAFTSNETHNARKIRQVAGNAVAHGLPWDAALAALTATPAEIFGLNGTRGRIVVGQVADLVLWSADPLEVTTAADEVWMGGKPIAMRSRQSDLRDRYIARLSRN